MVPNNLGGQRIFFFFFLYIDNTSSLKSIYVIKLIQRYLIIKIKKIKNSVSFQHNKFKIFFGKQMR